MFILLFPTSSNQQRQAVERKCLDKLKGFLNSLQNVDQQQQPKPQIQLTVLEKRRPSQQSILQQQGPPKPQQHHHTAGLSKINVSTSPNTQSTTIRQPIVVNGGSVKSSVAKLGGVIYSRSSSISLPPSPNRSMLIKKEPFISSRTTDPIGKYFFRFAFESH